MSLRHDRHPSVLRSAQPESAHYQERSLEQSPETQLAQLERAFQEYSGARLVFRRDHLPSGDYFDSLPPLTTENRLRAAQIALREIKKYPQGYLGSIGLDSIGIFDACVSRHNDGYHSYDSRYGGYLYYGVWNGANGIAAAYYSNEQLPLTIHHEIFHHVDGTRRGATDYSRNFTSDDDRFSAAISGQRPYQALAIGAADLAELKRRATGAVLSGAVSAYVTKSRGEDQAETARYVMSRLPDALIQAAEQPHLPGSQRILHVLNQYAEAAPDGRGVGWLVDAALGRRRADAVIAASPSSPGGSSSSSGLPAASPAAGMDLERALRVLRGAASPQWGAGGDAEYTEVRRALQSVAEAGSLPADKAEQIASAAAQAASALIRRRLQPDVSSQRYAIHGGEDASGINWTLRRDIEQFGRDAQALGRIAAMAPDGSAKAGQVLAENMRLLDSYREWIGSQWSISEGTEKVFSEARTLMAGALSGRFEAVRRIARLASAAEVSSGRGAPEARQALSDLAALAATTEGRGAAAASLPEAAKLVEGLMRGRLCPEGGQFHFWGKEDSDGVNWDLRRDIAQFAKDAQTLSQLAASSPGRSTEVSQAIARNIGLLGRYHAWLSSKFNITPGTEKVFADARREMVGSIPDEQLRRRLARGDAADAVQPRADPETPSLPAARPRLAARHNSYIGKVDGAIGSRSAEAQIKLVQPACLTVNGASGVNISPDGMALTNAHVANNRGERMYVEFPDGRKYVGTCVAIDHTLDLALVKFQPEAKVPYAPIARATPQAGTPVVCIGQPGGYDRWHVSTGQIYDFMPTHPYNGLGQVRHTAWTYWGNSGSPLFNHGGEVVALHNTWDSNTALRHAVPHWAIRRFLDNSNVSYSTGSPIDGLASRG